MTKPTDKEPIVPAPTTAPAAAPESKLFGTGYASLANTPTPPPGWLGEPGKAIPDPAPTPFVDSKQLIEPFEAIALRKSTPPWHLGAVKAMNGWAQGREVSEAEFDEACARALGAQMNPT